ncbi:hypothetical protein [Cohnella zeiphila]|uniref:Uncharacterized protein n=1 Tax=Cohnella zeiphila TaxID=2761120 RepID=A0A7X0VVW5_9BACL|nr:hypothetical protein [Cohnella zeiphila]MBB6731875.1 hypothetical protein [Cohnella zeiphila]
MSIIDEIRDTHKWVKNINENEPQKNETAQYWTERYIKDVQYLLSKLEIAEKALKEISEFDNDRPDCYPLYRIADAALEKLKEG